MMPRRLLPIVFFTIPLQLFAAAGLAGRSSFAAPDEATDRTISTTSAATTGEQGVDPAAIGAGQLLWKSARGLIPLPVVDISVNLEVTGVMARGSLTQTFSNPTDELIEAVYLFPLPERAAVDTMEMRIGDRRVVAVVQEKAEAKKTYETAKREGKKASLVDQRRPNLFSTSLANINPGEIVEVVIEYVEEVAYENGEFTLSFPLTYTPRFMPAPDAPRAGDDEPARDDAVHAVMRRTEQPQTARQGSVDAAARSGGAGGVEASAAPPVKDGCFVPSNNPLAPRARIAASIRTGVPLDAVHSPSHEIRVEEDAGTWRVAPDAGMVIADRDFVLRWRLQRGAEPEGTVFIEEREGERYALLMLVPPTAESEAGWGLPTTTLFIVDVSSSMSGASIRQARRALLAALDSLRPGDSFNLLRFNDHNEAYSERFQAVTTPAIDAAKVWVDKLEASGGTNIAPAVIRGLGMMALSDPWPAQRVILITDGAVGNEEEVFQRVSAGLGQARFHVIGIGSAPNRFLMRRLALFGRGTCDFIASVDEVAERMTAFLDRIDRPVMTDLGLDWEGPPPREVYPERLPDLYAGEPLYVSLRLDPHGEATRAILQGRLADRTVRTQLEVASGAPRGSGVATRWARARVRSAHGRLHRGADADLIRAEVIDVARAFNLVTRYTSLVAVEELRTAAGEWTTRPIPTGLPRGSTLLGATLPQGGTSGSLMMVAGLLLLSVAGVLYLLAYRAVR
jgi:Ca-activated chloride channel family protein